MASNEGGENEAEYLVSQSTHTCLTVLKGTGPADAVIGMAKPTGSAKQRWIVCGGQWQWAANRSYCLVPDFKKSQVGLAPSASSKVVWALDGANRLVVKSHALDVPWQKPRTRVIVYPHLHNGMNQKWWILSDLKACLSGHQPTQTSLPPTITTICQYEAQRRLHNQDGCQAQDIPDYLISQSTLTVVTVLRDKGGHNTKVVLAPYDGSKRQQWFFRDSQWQWGSDCSQCLAPDWSDYSLKLIPCTSAAHSWTLDNQGLLWTGSYVLDVPWEKPRTRVIVYPKHGDVNQRWWTLSSLKAGTGNKIYPFVASNVGMYKLEVARGLINKLSSLSEPLPHPRDVNQYPGSVAPTTPRISATVTLDLTSLGQRDNLRMTVPEDWQSTSLYVAAGDVFQVVLPDSLSPERASQITVRVGAQSDCLEPMSDNVTGKEFKRMPSVTEEFDVEPGANSMRSQYGGNLIFTYDTGENFKVNVEVRNVVKAPHFIMGQTSADAWQVMKQLDAPYSVLETSKVVLVVPTGAARKICNPDELLRRYDAVITKLNYLAGFDEMDPPPKGKQWLVDDVQITAGSAHAGFPAMFDRQCYDLCCDTTPRQWVTWHELGHNYQQGKWWSYAYGSESTVNLFSLYIQEELLGEDRLKKENRYACTAEAVDEGLTFEKADCWEKLVFLMEIKHAFPQQGWEMYRQVNRTTRALSKKEADTLASSCQRQYDYLYQVLSSAVGADLLPHYHRWGLPVSQEAQREIDRMGLQKAPADLSRRTQSREKCPVS